MRSSGTAHVKIFYHRILRMERMKVFLRPFGTEKNLFFRVSLYPDGSIAPGMAAAAWCGGCREAVPGGGDQREPPHRLQMPGRCKPAIANSPVAGPACGGMRRRALISFFNLPDAGVCGAHR